jgi:hypothetical protein
MTLVLRSVKRARWIIDEGTNRLLSNNDVPSDSLADLNTSSHKLSVWRIEPDQSNLDEIITAIASTRQKADHFSYILIDKNELSILGYAFDDNTGATEHKNANNWHSDLISLTGSSILSLSKVLFLKGKLATKTKSEIIRLITTACDQQLIPESKRSLCS